MTLAEALSGAEYANRKSRSKQILVPHALHLPIGGPPVRSSIIRARKEPRTIEVALRSEWWTCIEGNTGPLCWAGFRGAGDSHPQLNFFGVLKGVDNLIDWAHRQSAPVIAVVNPTTLAVLELSSEWGATITDVDCGGD
mgnify:CR=1